MEFMAMRSLSRELPNVLSRLQRDGELIMTNNGQPTILMIDLVGRDLVDVVAGFRESQSAKNKARRQNAALKNLVAGLQAIDDEPFDDEFDASMAKRPAITRELDL